MLRARLVVPAAVFAVSALIAVVPFVTSAAADSPAVAIHDGGDPTSWGYGPASTTIVVGQTVTFSNSGTSPHDATSTDGSWKTPLLQSGQSASVTFSTPGSFNYACVLHPWMQGSIIVTPAVSAPALAPSTADVSAPSVATVGAPPAPSTSDVAPVSNPAPQSDATTVDTGTDSGSDATN